MLNFTVKAGEYFTIGDDIKVVITGGTRNNFKVMVDAPRSYNIVREQVLERNATKEERANMKKYYPAPEKSAEDMKRLMAKQKSEKMKTFNYAEKKHA